MDNSVLPPILPPVEIAVPGSMEVPTPPTGKAPEWPVKRKKKWLPVVGGLLALVLVVGASFGAYYFTRNLNQADVPTAPSSEPSAKAKEFIGIQWVKTDKGVMVNKRFVDITGDTYTLTKDGVEAGLKINGNGTIINEDTGAAAVVAETTTVTCVDSTWTPDPALTCVGTNVTQTSNCGTTRAVAGTKTDGICVTPKTCSNGNYLSDDFSSATISPSKWNVGVGAGLSVTQPGGKLKLEAPVISSEGLGISSGENKITGDFDMSLDVDSFTATVTTAQGAATMELITFELGGPALSNVRLVRGLGNIYYADLISKKADGTTVDGDDYAITGTVSKIYLQRRGNEMEGFVKDGDKKVSVGKHLVYGTLPLDFGIASHRNNATMVAVVDNLVIGCACVPSASSWAPAASLTCVGTNVIQTNNCGSTQTVAGSKVCTTASGTADLNMEKRVYRNETTNTAGNYKYTNEIDTISKNQTFVIALEIVNDGTATASGIVAKDVLKGDNRELLTFVDSDSRCSYAASTRTVTCSGMSLGAGKSGVYALRVKVSDSAVNGDTILNNALLSYTGMPTGGESEGEVEVTISTVVGCDHICTTDEECGTGLSCDPETNKCRKPACADATNCICSSGVAPTRAATRAAVRVAQPTVLPETGILDFPGIAAFGGGLLMAIVGILLAL